VVAAQTGRGPRHQLPNPRRRTTRSSVQNLLCLIKTAHSSQWRGAGIINVIVSGSSSTKPSCLDFVVYWPPANAALRCTTAQGGWDLAALSHLRQHKRMPDAIFEPHTRPLLFNSLVKWARTFRFARFATCVRLLLGKGVTLSSAADHTAKHRERIITADYQT